MVADNRARKLLILLVPTSELPPVTAAAAGSSPVVPAIHSQELIETAPFSRGHKIGTETRVCVGRAYVSCAFSGNKSGTTASCAFRFSVVTACV